MVNLIRIVSEKIRRIAQNSTEGDRLRQIARSKVLDLSREDLASYLARKKLELRFFTYTPDGVVMAVVTKEGCFNVSQSIANETGLKYVEAGPLKNFFGIHFPKELSEERSSAILNRISELLSSEP